MDLQDYSKLKFTCTSLQDHKKKTTKIHVKWGDFKKKKLIHQGLHLAAKVQKCTLTLSPRRVVSILPRYKRGQNQLPVHKSGMESFMQVKVGSVLKLSQGQTE